MASKTYKRSCKVQVCVFKSISSTLSRLLSLFKGLNKLVSAQASLSGPSNILVVTLKPFNVLIKVFIDLTALPNVYLNEKLQDIIWVIIKTRPTAAKGLYECFLKTRFPNSYKSDNAGARRPNCILFIVFFLR